MEKPGVGGVGGGEGRIATLHGLRGLSIALVLIGHACGCGGLPRTPYAHILADAGVRMFFVISGFLITTLLMREREAHGAISLKHFYLRRTLRIFPAFYAYLAVVAVLAALGAASISGDDMAIAATYTANFEAHRPWLLGHLWSLSVEEQFYLLWPLSIIVLGALRAGHAAIWVTVAAPLLRLLTYYGLPGHRALLDQALPFVFDSLAMGCLLALYRRRLEANPLYRRVLEARWFWCIALPLTASLAVTRAWFNLGVGMTAGNLGIVLILHRCVSQPTRRAGRVLEHRALVWVGALSYSLYVWQQPFLDRGSMSLVCRFPLNILLAFATAVAWYYLAEQPLLRLRGVVGRPRGTAPRAGLLMQDVLLDLSQASGPRSRRVPRRASFRDVPRPPTSEGSTVASSSEPLS